MPKYNVAFTGKAQKDLERIPDDEADRILRACIRLRSNPNPDGKHVKKLQGYENLYRLRVGDYRIVFEWSGDDVAVVRLLTRQDFGKRY